MKTKTNTLFCNAPHHKRMVMDPTGNKQVVANPCQGPVDMGRGHILYYMHAAIFYLLPSIQFILSVTHIQSVLEFAIRFTSQDDYMADLCAGTGSQGIGAMQEGRRVVFFDMDKLQESSMRQFVTAQGMALNKQAKRLRRKHNPDDPLPDPNFCWLKPRDLADPNWRANRKAMAKEEKQPEPYHPKNEVVEEDDEEDGELGYDDTALAEGLGIDIKLTQEATQTNITKRNEQVHIYIMYVGL